MHRLSGTPWSRVSRKLKRIHCFVFLSHKLSTSEPTDQIWIGGWIGVVPPEGPKTSQPSEECSKTSGNDRGRPLLILVFAKDASMDYDFGQLVWGQYNRAEKDGEDPCGLFARLKHQPLYLCLDLFNMFTDWEGVISKRKKALREWVCINIKITRRT